MYHLSRVSKEIAKNLKIYSRAINLSSKNERFTPSHNIKKINSDSYEIKSIWIEVGQEVEEALDKYSERERINRTSRRNKRECTISGSQ